MNQSFTRETTGHTTSQQYLTALAVSFARDYLTVDLFAEHHSIPAELALAMLEEGRRILAGRGCLY